MPSAAQVPAVRHEESRPCPFWIGWLLASPLRRLLEKPEDLVLPLLSQGSRVLEVGPGMGFFTLPIAQHVGAEGRVYCVDVQPEMLRGLERRVQKKKYGDRVETRLCTATELPVGDLEGSIHLATLIYVLHEVADPRAVLQVMARTLAPNGRLLLAEPGGHVKRDQFLNELQMAREAGLVPVEPCPVATSPRRHLALLSRSSSPRS